MAKPKKKESKKEETKVKLKSELVYANLLELLPYDIQKSDWNKKKESVEEEEKKEEEKNKEFKKNILFNLLSYLTYQKKPWEELHPEEQKAFNPFIINRFLSMDIGLLEFVNYLQKYTLIIDKKEVYKLYLNMIPQEKFFFKYVKPETELPEKDINVLVKYFSISTTEAEDHLITLNKTDEGREILKNLKRNYNT